MKITVETSMAINGESIQLQAEMSIVGNETTFYSEIKAWGEDQEPIELNETDLDRAESYLTEAYNDFQDICDLAEEW